MSDKEVMAKRGGERSEPDPLHRYLDVTEVMANLRISRRRFYYWCAEGTMKSIRVGRSLRVHVDEVARMKRDYFET